MMLTARKKRIAGAFSRAVPTYDPAAGTQRRAADKLADMISNRLNSLNPVENDRLDVLEIGCGTGILTHRLLRMTGRMGKLRYLASDLSWAMCAELKKRLRPVHGLMPVVMDGESPGCGTEFDLIVSSMTFQWFEDLAGGIARNSSLLKKGGSLFFSLPGKEYFREWREAYIRAGGGAGMRFPDLPAVLKLCPAGFSCRGSEDIFTSEYSCPLEIVRNLRRLGAGTAPEGQKPLGVSEFKNALASYDESWRDNESGRVKITEHLVYAHFIRE